MKKIISFLFALLLCLGLVIAYTVTINSPSDYSIQTTTSVTFNVTCKLPDGDTSTLMNASIYWKTNRSGAYLNNSYLGAKFQNNTANTSSVTFADSTRYWWYSSCFDLFNEFTVTNESITLPSTNRTIVNLTNDTYKVSNAVGFVNNTGSWRLMVEDSDYVITNNLINLTNASLCNNKSLWTYNWPYMIINQTNSSTIRILDVDTDYQTLSFGTSKLINMTLDTGNIVVSGNVTADNLIGDLVDAVLSLTNFTTTNLWVTNLESNIDGTGYNFTGNWFKGIFNWAIKSDSANYLNFNGTDLSLNETKLNLAIDARENDTKYTNLSFDLSQIPNTGTVNIGSYTLLIGKNTSAVTCNSATAGSLYYDNTTFKHYGCNTTAWVALY